MVDKITFETKISDNFSIIIAFATVMPLLDKMVVVKEEWIALAILRLVELEKCVVEGAGAAGLAAILAGHLDEFKGKKYVDSWK